MEKSRQAPADVYVGVGSNIDPQYGLRRGIEMMRAAFDELRVSSVYRSPSFGFTGDDFLNVVVHFRSNLTPDAIENRLNAIERSDEFEPGGGRFAPRALDCDLLMYGAQVDAGRRLPRDDVLRYPFVLGPLAEIAPDARHPLDGRSFSEHWVRRRDGVELQRECEFADLQLPADAASAVDGQNLSGDIRRVSREV